MKKFKFILVSLLAALAFSACSTGDDVTQVVINPKGDESTLVVKIATADLQTKTVGYGDNQYVETKIANAVIGTFFEDGSLNVIREVSFAEGAETKSIFSLKAGNIKVYVIANVDVDLFKSVSNENDLKSVILSLDQSIIPLSANKTVIIKSKETTVTDIYLERIVSKLSINKIEVGLVNNGFSNATFSVDKVFLHNANTKSTIDYITSEPKSGLTESYLLDYKVDFFGYYVRHYFYAFESNLKLVIGGWFKDGSRQAEYLYYPIPVDAKHNTHYMLTAKINGKGVKSPDDNFDASGKLQTTLKVLPWNEENIDVIFE